MSIEVADLIQINAEVECLGQTCLNVFHYRVASRDAGVVYQDVQDAFNEWWGVSVVPITSANAILTRQTILNLTNGLDIHEDVVSTPGGLSGDDLPSFNAWGFQLVRTTRLTRHGSKRFVGVLEAQTVGNEPAAGLVDELNTCAAKLKEGIVRSGTAADMTLTPIIIGRTKNLAGVYELDLAKVNLVADAVFTRITSQNSRKKD